MMKSALYHALAPLMAPPAQAGLWTKLTDAVQHEKTVSFYHSTSISQ